MQTLKFIESIMKRCILREDVMMSRLTRTARHVALDSDLTLHISLHQNSLQHLTSRWERDYFFYMLRKRCPAFGSLTLEPRTTDSLSITSTNISLFPPWINAHKTCMQMLSYLKHALYCCVLYSFWIPDYSAPSYLLSAGLDGSGGCRTRRHFTLLCLSPKLKKDSFNFSHWRKSK